MMCWWFSRCRVQPHEGFGTPPAGACMTDGRWDVGRGHTLKLQREDACVGARVYIWPVSAVVADFMFRSEFKSFV
jgi:hypothetical protein